MSFCLFLTVMTDSCNFTPEKLRKHMDFNMRINIHLTFEIITKKSYVFYKPGCNMLSIAKLHFFNS